MSNRSSSRARSPHASASASVFRIVGKWFAAFVLVSATAGFGSCSSSGGGGGGGAPNYVLQGSVSGLLPGESVALQDFGHDTITLSANGSFEFSMPFPGGTPYLVTVLTQPTGENCTTVNGSGTGTVGPGSEVSVACNAVSFSVSGTIQYATGPVVLQLFYAADILTTPIGPPVTVTELQANVPVAFTLASTAPLGAAYAIGILSSPDAPYEGCYFVNDTETGVGTAAATDAQIRCGALLVPAVSGLLPNTSVTLNVSDPTEEDGTPAPPDTWTVTASGQCTGLVVQDHECVRIIDPSAVLSVTVASQPVGEMCTVGAVQGTEGQGGLTVPVSCVPASFTIGGTVSGLSAGNSVVLEDNGGNATTVSANGPFTFSTPIANQTPYVVTVSTPPAGGTCAVSNGSGTVSGTNVANVTVVCTTANAGLWTWESGSNSSATSYLGVYGTQGTAAPGNFPGGRGDAAFTWTDGVGNLWMFGGGGPGNSGVGGLFNDLWRYSLSTGLWAWMSGADTLGAQSVYGTLGTPAAGNVPSAREGGTSWIDGAGNLWMFGGGGFDSTGHEDLGLSDLWRFSPGTGLWTWMNGPTTGNMVGVYGTQGTPAPANVPGGRTALVSFKDSAGNFWLFGGAGFDSIGNGNSSLNDLWRYSPSSGMWTWMGGSNRGNAKGVYGTQDTPATGNLPGARSSAVSWTDGAGNFWLFGGSGYDSTGSNNSLNDLWRYSPSSGMWTWMSGSNLGNANGVYGTLGTAAAGNIPGARSSAVSWIDGTGNLWLFGGYGNDSIGNEGVLNDLWRYSPSTNLWTWMGGSTTQGAAGVYGTEGTAAAGNIPGARQFASSWTDGAGNLWLFGGDVAAALNDLWQYLPPGP